MFLLFGLVRAVPALSVSIQSPVNNTEYDPGDTVVVVVNYWDSVAGVDTLYCTFNGETKYWSFPFYPPSLSGSKQFSFIVPNGAPGQSLPIEVELTDYVDDPAHAYGAIKIGGPDVTAPTYAGTVGLLTAERLVGNTSTRLTWSQAQDNVTAAGALRYDIYYSTSQATVFSAGVKQTVTADTTVVIDNLTALQTYYFAVRARDEAGNRESNTVIKENKPIPNAAHGWMLFE
jgi:hypothetical protein